MPIGDEVNQKFANIDAAGAQTEKDNWARYKTGLVLDGGIPEELASALANRPDAVGLIKQAGREGLLAHMPSSTRASQDGRDAEAIAQQMQAEKDYAAIREQERAEHRKRKGRVV
jgi:hypothetical protein